MLGLLDSANIEDLPVLVGFLLQSVNTADAQDVHHFVFVNKANFNFA